MLREKKQIGPQMGRYCAPLHCCAWPSRWQAEGCCASVLYWAKKKGFNPEKKKKNRGSIDALLPPCSTYWNEHGQIGDGRGAHREAGRWRGRARGGAPQPVEVEPGAGVASHELARAPAMVAMVEKFVEILCGSSSRVLAPNEEGRGEGVGWSG